MTNFFRNWGGSFGIAFVNSVSERRFNFHQLVVGSNLPASSGALQQRVNQAAACLHAHGFSGGDAHQAAYAYVYSQLQLHAHFLAFMDCFRAVGILWLIAAPLILLTKPFAVEGSGSSAH